MRHARCAALLACTVATGLSAQQTAPTAAPAADDGPVVLDPLTVKGIPMVIPKPRIRYNPPYPMQARDRWEEGCVVLQFTIRPDGKTDDFTVLASNPVGAFERDVIMAVYRWHYEPKPKARTIVELFEFRNPRLTTSPTYTMVNSERQLRTVTPMGPTYELVMQLEGYKRPTCGQWEKLLPKSARSIVVPTPGKSGAATPASAASAAPE